MLRLRFYLISLLLFIEIALNVERLDFGAKENAINLASFVYLLLGISVMSTILIPRKWKISTRTITIFWVVGYSIIKIIFRNDLPFVGGLYTYLSIAEIVIIVSSIILTRKVMESLEGLEETVANITLVDVSSRVKSLDEAAVEVRKELSRSRRYKRPLGVVVIKLKPENAHVNIDELSKDILRIMASHYSISNLIRAIDKELRRPDLILKQPIDNSVILLLPEGDGEATQTVTENIQALAERKIGSRVDIGYATFPNDAITFDGLVSYAERKLGEAKIGLPEGDDIDTEKVQPEHKGTIVSTLANTP